jgi:hypothetical protein
VRIVSRAEWGAAPADHTTELTPALVRLFVVHHTATPFRGSRSIRGIQQFHQGPDRLWSDIGYNFLVAPDGMVYEGRGWAFRGAHAKGHNFESIGVAYVGFGDRPVPGPAKRAIMDLHREAEKRFGELEVVGHRDVGRTACPGNTLYRWVAQVDADEPQPRSRGVVAEKGELAAQRISERLSPIPDLRDGWRRQMSRMGWLRRK